MTEYLAIIACGCTGIGNPGMRSSSKADDSHNVANSCDPLRGDDRNGAMLPSASLPFNYKANGTPLSLTSQQIVTIGACPHSFLFQHLIAVVHHEGTGSVAATLHAGLPSVIVPFSGNQFFWAGVVK